MSKEKTDFKRGDILQLAYGKYDYSIFKTLIVKKKIDLSDLATLFDKETNDGDGVCFYDFADWLVDNKYASAKFFAWGFFCRGIYEVDLGEYGDFKEYLVSRAQCEAPDVAKAV